MDKRLLARHLETIATQEIPNDMNKWPEIRAQLESSGVAVRRPLRLSGYAAAALTLAVLLMTSLVAYAVYQWGDGDTRPDPGIDGIRDAGLVQPINIAQTVDDITITLIEGYADPNRIVVWYTVDYPAGMPPEYLNTLAWVLQDADGNFINSSIAYSPLDAADIPTYQLDFGLADFMLAGPIDLQLIANIGNAQTLILPTDATLPAGPVPEEYIVNVPPFGPFEFAFSLDVQETVLTLTPDVTIESNGVSITLAQISIAPSQTIFRLCYDLPTSQDWQPHFSAVTVDDGPGMPLGFGLVDPRPTGTETNRCADYNYSAAAVKLPETLRIEINRLQATVPEGMQNLDYERAHERLAVQGIEVEFSAPPNFMWEIIEKPAEMTDSEVGMAVWDSIAEWHEGEWVFEIPLSE